MALGKRRREAGWVCLWGPAAAQQELQGKHSPEEPLWGRPAGPCLPTSVTGPQLESRLA